MKLCSTDKLYDTSPVKLAPVIKDYIWGGNRLKDEFNKKTSFMHAAESWELSAVCGCESIIASGIFRGLTLSEYIKRNGRTCLGNQVAYKNEFPVLIKLIDAAKNLSVQVHPNDEFAAKHEKGHGKAELWYVVDCTDDAFVYYGLKHSVTAAELKKHIKCGTVTNILNKIKITKDMFIFVPPGTIHAIGAGALICEIQQNSDITYRLYDYDRTDKDGHPRRLHIEKALAAAVLAPVNTDLSANVEIINCGYFTAEKINCHGSSVMRLDNQSFRAVTLINGRGTIRSGEVSLTLKKGDSVFIPAQNQSINLSGYMECIAVHI